MKKWLISCIVLFAIHGYANSDLFRTSVANKSITIQTTAPNHSYPAAGIKINSPEYTLTGIGTACQLAANGYCLFSVSDTQPAILSITGPSNATLNMTLCLNGQGPLSCEEHTAMVKQSFLYVTNVQGLPGDSNNVALCEIQSNGQLENCQPAAGNATSLSDPVGIALNPTQMIAYISNLGTALDVCPIANTDSLESCIQTDTSIVSVASLAISPDGQFLYEPDATQDQLLACPILANGTVGTCSPTGDFASNPLLAVTLNQAGTYAYVTAVAATEMFIFVCTVSHGTFSNCTQTGSIFSSASNYLVNLALNPAESFLYLTNRDTNVYACPVHSDGTLGSCITAFASLVFPSGIVFNSSNNLAYIANSGADTVLICTPQSDGAFSSCIDSGVGSTPFAFPSGLALKN